MGTTNVMLKIAANNTDQIGYLFLIMTGVYIFYVLLSIEINKYRVSKIKRAVAMIKEGHERADKAKLQERMKNPHQGGYFHA